MVIQSTVSCVLFLLAAIVNCFTANSCYDDTLAMNSKGLVLFLLVVTVVLLWSYLVDIVAAVSCCFYLSLLLFYCGDFLACQQKGLKNKQKTNFSLLSWSFRAANWPVSRKFSLFLITIVS